MGLEVKTALVDSALGPVLMSETWPLFPLRAKIEILKLLK